MGNAAGQNIAGGIAGIQNRPCHAGELEVGIVGANIVGNIADAAVDGHRGNKAGAVGDLAVEGSAVIGHKLGIDQASTVPLIELGEVGLVVIGDGAIDDLTVLTQAELGTGVVSGQKLVEPDSAGVALTGGERILAGRILLLDSLHHFFPLINGLGERKTIFVQNVLAEDRAGGNGDADGKGVKGLILARVGAHLTRISLVALENLQIVGSILADQRIHIDKNALVNQFGKTHGSGRELPDNDIGVFAGTDHEVKLVSLAAGGGVNELQFYAELLCGGLDTGHAAIIANDAGRIIAHVDGQLLVFGGQRIGGLDRLDRLRVVSCGFGIGGRGFRGGSRRGGVAAGGQSHHHQDGQKQGEKTSGFFHSV